MARDRLRDGLREALAIDGERGAGGNAGELGGPHDQRAQPPHLFLEEPDGVIELVAAERVAADQLRQPIGLVDQRRPDRTHLVQDHRHAARRDLPRGFGTGETTANDVGLPA